MWLGLSHHTNIFFRFLYIFSIQQFYTLYTFQQYSYFLFLLFVLHWRLLIVFSVDDLVPTHGTDSLLVGTGLAVVGTNLVDFCFAYPTFLEIWVVGIKPVLLGRQEFVLSNFSSTSVCIVPCSILPSVWSDHFSQLSFLLTFVTNHFNSLFF